MSFVVAKRCGVAVLMLGAAGCNGTAIDRRGTNCTHGNCAPDAAAPFDSGRGPLRDSGGSSPIRPSDAASTPEASLPPPDGAAPDSGPADGAAPLTLSAFCEALSGRTRTWATLLRRCCSSPLAESAAVLQGLLSALGDPDQAAARCSDGFSRMVADGKAVFDATEAQGCIDAFNETIVAPPSSCPSSEGFEHKSFLLMLGQGVPVFEQLPACRRALPGKVPDQGACADVFDCEFPLICPSAAAFGLDAHICQKAGTACVRSSDCPLGSICTGSSQRRCTPIGMLSNPAHSCSGNAECPVGHPCMDTFCGAFWPGEPAGTACGASAPTYVECIGYCDPAASECRPFCAP